MRVLITTGASSGIGLATASRFMEASYQAICLSRRPCPLDGVESIHCDLSRQGFSTELEPLLIPKVEQAASVCLIHNAARLQKDAGADVEAGALREVLEINVIAPSTLTKMILPYMKPGSSVLFVGSTLAEKAVPNSFSYVTSKHAQVGMMRALCQDLADTGVHTSMICPGFTDTEMLRSHLPPEALQSVADMSAFRRLVEPSEIAETLLWAAENPVLNGSVIHANLGQIER